MLTGGKKQNARRHRASSALKTKMKGKVYTRIQIWEKLLL